MKTSLLLDTLDKREGDILKIQDKNVTEEEDISAPFHGKGKRMKL